MTARTPNVIPDKLGPDSSIDIGVEPSLVFYNGVLVEPDAGYHFEGGTIYFHLNMRVDDKLTLVFPKVGMTIWIRLTYHGIRSKLVCTDLG